jgi:hypothetical protein
MCVPVKRISGHFAAFTPGHDCGIPSWLLYGFVARDFPTKRLSEKWQSFVGNDKRLSETTNACWKQQTLVGNDKA